MKKLIAGIAVATALLGVAAVAGAQTVAFTQNLTIGSTGPEVVALQTWLEAKGYLMIPAGTTKGYFGALTQAAVAKYQAAKGITPAVGYFGPITRTAVNAEQSVVVNPPAGGTTPGCPTGAIFNNITGEKCSTNPNPSMGGAEGDLRNIQTIGGTDSSVEEGDSDVKVLGFQLEARDSDISLERVDVDFLLDGSGTSNVPTGASKNLNHYIDSASLWLDGKKLASEDVDEADENDDIFTFRFTDLKGTITKDDISKLYVTVDAIRGVDQDDENTDIEVRIPENGIRAVDEAGISDTYVDSDSDLTDTFSVGQHSNGELRVDFNDTDNDARTIEVDNDNTTEKVSLLTFSLDSQDQTNNVQEMTVDFATTSGTVNRISDVLESVYLYADGEEVGNESVSGTDSSVTFDDLDIDVKEDESVDFEVKADVAPIDDDNNYTAGTEISATVTADSNSIDAEDEQGDTVDISGTDAEGGVITLRENGTDIEAVDLGDPTADDHGDASSTDTTGEFSIDFKVMAFGDDIYVPLTASQSVGSGTSTTAGALFTIEDSQGNIASSTRTSAISSVLTRRSGGSTVSGNRAKVNEGSSVTFRLDVSFDPSVAGFFRLQLNGINFKIGSNATPDQTELATPEEDFETAPVNIQP